MSEYTTLDQLPADESDALDIIAELGSEDLLMLQMDCQKTVMGLEAPYSEQDEKMIRLGIAVTRRARHVRESKKTATRAKPKAKVTSIEDLL